MQAGRPKLWVRHASHRVVQRFYPAKEPELSSPLLSSDEEGKKMEIQNQGIETFNLDETEYRHYQAFGVKGVHMGIIKEIYYDPNKTDKRLVARDIARQGLFICPDCEWRTMDGSVVEHANQMRS